MVKRPGYMNNRVEISLSLTVALYSALVIALGMAVYAVFQYFLTPERTVLSLVLQHSWHVLVLGVLIYVTLHAVLYKKVVRPIQDIYVRLYAITKGDLSPISVDSNITEIQEIVEGIRFLISEIKKSTPAISLSDLSKVAGDLRSLAKKSVALEESTKEELMEIAVRIDGVAEALSNEAVNKQEK